MEEPRAAGPWPAGAASSAWPWSPWQPCPGPGRPAWCRTPPWSRKVSYLVSPSGFPGGFGFGFGGVCLGKWPLGRGRVRTSCPRAGTVSCALSPRARASEGRPLAAQLQAERVVRCFWRAWLCAGRGARGRRFTPVQARSRGGARRELPGAPGAPAGGRASLAMSTTSVSRQKEPLRETAHI